MTRPPKLPHICTRLAFDRETEVCPACAGTTEERVRATQALLDEKAAIDRDAAALLRALPGLLKEIRTAWTEYRELDMLAALMAIEDEAMRITTHWSRT